MYNVERGNLADGLQIFEQTNPADNDHDNASGFVGLFKDFEYFAAKYKAEAGRHAVLVLDNINVLANEYPKILDTPPCCKRGPVADHNNALPINTAL